MSVYVSKWVMRHSKTKGSARVVALALAYRSDETGKCRAWSMDWLTKMTRLSKRTVRRCLEELAQNGEVAFDGAEGAWFIEYAKARGTAWRMEKELKR